LRGGGRKASVLRGDGGSLKDKVDKSSLRSRYKRGSGFWMVPIKTTGESEIGLLGPDRLRATRDLLCEEGQKVL